jgi:hypothetical protein
MAEEQPQSKGKKIVKLLLMLFLLLVLIIGGFALGIYLRLFDTQSANEKLGLYNLPIIGQYFVKPAPTKDEMENTPVEDAKPEKDKPEAKKVTISKKEIEKQMKEREAQEKKRVSKLARLYNEMKPRDAAQAMDSLDDDLCIAILQRMEEGNAAKVLSEFEASKTARLTQIMYEGTKKKMNTEDDARKTLEDQQSNPNGDAAAQ